MTNTFKKLISPRSKKEDEKRREFILNILLAGNILLSMTATIITSVNSIRFHVYTGISPLIPFVILIIFIILYFLSRLGFFIISAYFLILFYLLPVVYSTYYWGVGLHTTLLSYTLIIVMSGILIGTHLAFIITILISLIIIIINYLHLYNIVQPDLYWRTNDTTNMGNVMLFVAIFGIIAAVSWLHNREIEKALKKCRESECKLQKERDSLEIKIDDRTKELKKMQLEKVSQLYRLAEFGKLASGMIHDLSNPLTVISLNLEKTNNQCGQKLTEIKTNILKAIDATKRIEYFITATRKQITNQENKITFSPSEEIVQVIQILNHKARKHKIHILFSPSNSIQTFGDSIKFNHLISNLISNAIDAYAGIPLNQNHRKIEVKLYEENNVIIISIRDWGCGMPYEYIQKIFTPLFTTKGFDCGTGIGLSNVKNIVYKNFKGKIKLGSRIGKGTIFIIEIPKQNNPN